MPWPLSQDYNEAIQSPDSSFADPELRGGQPVTNALGMPMPRSGNFADVYEFICASGAKWAIKCFTREVSGLQQRYSEISKHLMQAKLPFTVDFKYLEKGIRIHGQWYPVLKMQWVDGFLLNEFVRNNLDKPALLEELGKIWLRMARRLREADLAHADLQHGNILLVTGSQASSLAVKLIDYDGMWVPALANKKSGEVGHPAYQHPARLQQGTYSAEVDRVPLLVVACALRCLVVGGKSLWGRYDNGDNLLFRETDLKAPDKSPLFKELDGISDPQARTLVRELHDALQQKLEDVPVIDKLLPETKLPNVRVPANPTTAAKPGHPLATTGSSWDFDEASSPESKRREKVRRRGIPFWALVAGGGVVAVVFVSTLLLVFLWPDTLKPIAKGNQPGNREHIDKVADKGKDKDADKGKDADNGKDKDKVKPDMDGKPIEVKNENGKGVFQGKLLKTDPIYKGGKKHKMLLFQMEAGKTYQIDMTSNAFDSYLFLESPSGKYITEDDDSGGYPNARIIHKATDAGQYRIACTSFHPATGDFKVTICQTN
jgi:hypothetical protein